MKAVEFVKYHGWKCVEDIVEKYGDSHTHVTNDARMFIHKDAYSSYAPHFKQTLDTAIKMSDLKTLVEAKDWIDLCGGLGDAKALAVVHNDKELQKAIKLVESVENA